MHRSQSSIRTWFRSGDPWIWMIGGALAISLIMVIGLMTLIAVRGFGHFWAKPIAETTATVDGIETPVLGIMTRSETLPAERIRESGQPIPQDQLLVTRYLFNIGNRDLTGRDFVWYLESALSDLRYPDQAMMVERREWGNFYGFPEALERQGAVVASGEQLWGELQRAIQRANDLHDQIRRLEKVEIGAINSAMERVRLERRGLELRGVSGAALEAARVDLETRQTELDRRFQAIQAERTQLMELAGRDVLIARTAADREVRIGLDNIVMASQNNAMGLGAKLLFYGHRIKQFLT
ncbi:MAG: hypothetical protein LC637_00155, partial [Xanthomonadaceae bacterium]|nr:hypothetical protein [Xanthomonadaceae bacterium]